MYQSIIENQEQRLYDHSANDSWEWRVEDFRMPPTHIMTRINWVTVFGEWDFGTVNVFLVKINHFSADLDSIYIRRKAIKFSL